MSGITIVCYGDSITYGYCAEYGKDYVSLFKNKVKEDFPEAPITIKNRGENGETSRDGLKRLDAHILSYKTDMVIMLFGSNDSAYNIPVPQMMVRHDRIAAVLFYPKYCHFTDASFRCKQKKQRPFAPGDGRSERCAYLIIFRLCGI